MAKKPKKETKKTKKASEQSFKKKVVKVLNQVSEIKYKDTGLNNVSIDNVFDYFTLTAINVGTGQSSRIGDEVDLVGMVKVRMAINCYVSGANLTLPIVRVIFFQYHSVSDPASPPAISTILDPDNGGLYSTFSHHSYDNRQDYTILYDKNMILTPAGGSNNAFNPNIHVMRNFYVSLKRARKSIAWLNATPTIASGHIYCYILSNDPSAGTNPVAFVTCRTLYRDS